MTAAQDPLDYSDLFRHALLANLHYWQNYLAEPALETELLAAERENILKAIQFGLGWGEAAWPVAQELILALSPYMERSGYWDAWGRLLNQAFRVASQLGDTLNLISIAILMARLAQRQSRLPAAIVHYRQVIRLARQAGDRFSEGRACTNLGYLYTEQGRYWRAERLCCRALLLFEQLQNDYGRAHTESHLGVLYTRQGRWTEAEQRLENACALWQVMANLHGLMAGLINLGLLYNEMEQPDQALTSLEKALEYARLSGETAELGVIYLNQAFAYRLKDEATQLEACARQAELIFRRLSDDLYLAFAQVNLGIAYLKHRRWTEAKSYLETALESCSQLGNLYGEAEARLGLVEYEFARQHWPQAVVSLNKLKQLAHQHPQLGVNRRLQKGIARYQAFLDTPHLQTSEVVKTPEV